MDQDLWHVRKSALATETVRYATPRNPLTLNPGRSTRPIIGTTWDPYLTNVPAGAVGNVLAIGAAQVQVPLPFGTLLTNPLLFATANVGSDFAIPIPNNVALAGVLAMVQGLSVTSTGGILLSSALDIQVGDF